MKKLLIVAASAAVCGFLSTASLAAKATATEGFRIFNQNQSLDYTTTNPSACTGVTFPTPIAHGGNGVIKMTSDFQQSNNVCSTQYTIGSATCLVSVVPSQDGKVKIYAQGLSGQNCYAINGNTAVILQ